MIRNVLIGCVLVIVFVASLIAMMPIGYPLRLAGLERSGVSYATAEGTIMSSRISGVEMAGQPIGDVLLDLRIWSLLSGRLSYDVQWGGPSGRGAGQVSVVPTGQLELGRLNAEQNIAALEGLMNAVRDVGGTVRIRNGALSVGQDRCESGSANISSDILTLAAQPYGRNFGDIVGTLSCQDGAFVVDLESQSDSGDTFDVLARAELSGVSEVTAEVRTNDPELAIVLGQLEFENEDGVWRYSTIRGL